MTGEYLLGISQTGLTLENLDTLAPGTIAIIGAANNGAGLIRITVGSAASLATGQVVSISGVVGRTTEANATRTGRSSSSTARISILSVYDICKLPTFPAAPLPARWIT